MSDHLETTTLVPRAPATSRAADPAPPDPRGWQGLDADAAPAPLGDPLTGPMPPVRRGHTDAHPTSRPATPPAPRGSRDAVARAHAHRTAGRSAARLGAARRPAGRAARPAAPARPAPAQTQQARRPPRGSRRSSGSCPPPTSSTGAPTRSTSDRPPGAGAARSGAGAAAPSRPKMGPAEVPYEHDRRAIQRDFEGPAHDRLPQPEGRCGQDDRRARRGLHLRHRPWRRGGRLGQQRDPRHPRDPRPPQHAPQHHA